MSIAKRTANNMFWLFMSDVCARGLSFLSTVYLARVLDVSGFGLYSLALAVSTYMCIAADMGVAEYGIRETARDTSRANNLLNSLNSFRFTSAIICLFLLGITLFVLNIPNETKWITLAGALYVLVYAIFPDWLLKGIEKMGYIALGNFIEGIVFLGGVYFLVKSPADKITASLYHSLAMLPACLFILFIIRKKIGIKFSFRFSPSDWWGHLRESWYFGLNTGLVAIERYIPLFILGIWVGHKEVGLFSASLRLILSVFAIAVMIHGASYPIFSGLYLKDKDKFRETHRSFQKLAVYIGLPLGIIGMFLGKELIEFLYGSRYVEAAGIIKVMVWVIPLKFLRIDYNRLLVSAGFQKFRLFASGGGLATEIILSFLLIPRYGGTGAAWAMVTGEGLALIATAFIFGAKLYRSNPVNFYFFRVAAASILASVLINRMAIHILPKLIIGLILYGILSLMLGLVSKKEITSLYQVIRYSSR